jgi:Tfp pilus assembly protein PilP
MGKIIATLAAALVSTALLAQEPAAPAESAEAPPAQPTDAGARIDEILEGEEAVLQGLAYSYDPGNRRDPFKSLELGRGRPEIKGPLPEGIAGLLIDEIDLTGIFKTSRGFIAQVVAPNKNKSYLVREGDQLYDGDVVRISQNEVVFKQIVNDPTVLKPYREVVKKLSP